MTLTKRISELLQALSAGIPEREFCLQLGFLTALVGEPFYLYGRSGSGKSLITDRIIAAFKGSKVLKIGKRETDIPEKLSTYDLVIFQSFDPMDESEKYNVQIALQDKEKSSLIISGDLRPEVALNRGEITDQITLTVALPDSISPSALCSLLKTRGDVTATYVPLGLAVSVEEKAQWNEEIKKVALSEDTLTVIGKVAEVCDQNNIYVPIRKWIALTNIIKAAAFFNGRTETRLTDSFFLGTPIWGRSTSNHTIVEKYKEIVYDCLLKDTPSSRENPYDAGALLARVKRIINTSNNLYETRMFNNEPCLYYKITIAGEPTPLYAPLRYIETDQDFHPYNELRQEEKKVRCNFRGTSNCTIAIDTAVKSTGLRNAAARSSTSNLQGKFEEFATLPAYILKENDPDIIAQKNTQLEEIRKEIQGISEQEGKNLIALRDVYRNIKESKDDLFCHMAFFEEAQTEVKSLFERTADTINKIKEAHSLLASFGK